MLEPQLPIHCVPPPGNNPTSARLSGSPTEAPFAASAATVTTRWRPLHQPDSPPPSQLTIYPQYFLSLSISGCHPAWPLPHPAGASLVREEKGDPGPRRAGPGSPSWG